MFNSKTKTYRCDAGILKRNGKGIETNCNRRATVWCQCRTGTIIDYCAKHEHYIGHIEHTGPVKDQGERTN